jgi:hypothetical protein
LFQLVLSGRPDTVILAEALALKQKFKAQMSAADIASVDLLLAELSPVDGASSWVKALDGDK